MDHIVTLDSRQQAALQAIADQFIAQHKGGAQGDDRAQRASAGAA